MKNLIKILTYSLSLGVVATLYSCDSDDATGHSTLTPTAPTISITGGGAQSAVFDDANSTVTFGITMSTEQIVDVAVHVFVTGGDATEGEDFEISDSRVVIPAFSTSASVDVTILADALSEATETFTIQIGDERTANASVTPVTASFTIRNATSDQLFAALSWETDALDAVGLDLTSTAVVDFRMLIIDDSDGSTVTVIDGAGFEEYSGFNSLADGDYLIAVDIYSTIDAGDFNAPVTIDIDLVFDQLGVINGSTLSFPGVRTNENACDANRTYLARVTKSGSDFTMVEEVSSVTLMQSTDVLVGSYVGSDIQLTPGNGFDSFDSQVETQGGLLDLSITGLGFGWMLDFWGETVVSNNFVTVEVDLANLTLNIPEQDYIVTDFNGTLYPYTIVGTGTVTDACGGGLHIEYDMLQAGFSTAGWTVGAGWMTCCTLWTADITVD